MPNYYSKKELRTLKIQFWVFRLVQKRVLKELIPSIPKKERKALLGQTKIIFDRMLMEIPYIGGKNNFFTQYLLKSFLLLPLVKILDEQRFEERTIGQIIVRSSEKAFDLIQKPFKKKFQKNIFSSEHSALLERLSIRPEEEISEFDWKMEFIPDIVPQGAKIQPYSIIYRKCGICNLWKRENLGKYAPYMCLTDWIKWDNANLKVTRTKTLANGADQCDFHFQGTGSNGYRGWPPEDAEEWKRS